jgi:hypothetical protein
MQGDDQHRDQGRRTQEVLGQINGPAGDGVAKIVEHPGTFR